MANTNVAHAGRNEIISIVSLHDALQRGSMPFPMGPMRFISLESYFEYYSCLYLAISIRNHGYSYTTNAASERNLALFSDTLCQIQVASLVVYRFRRVNSSFQLSLTLASSCIGALGAMLPQTILGSRRRSKKLS